MEDQNRMSAERRELWERIEKVRPAMITTAELDGSFRSRPMWTQGDEFDGSLWFFVSDDGPLARELERNPRVGLSYAAPDKDLYVSVSGRAALVHDRTAVAGELAQAVDGATFASSLRELVELASGGLVLVADGDALVVRSQAGTFRLVVEGGPRRNLGVG